MTVPGLVVAVGDYDHTRDLVSGRVRPVGLDATVLAIDTPEELFGRVLDGGEFDAAELSLAVCSTLLARGDDRFVALPVFPARSFRHAAIYVRADGPSAPAGLDGARIGIPAWAQTAGVYVRGMLAAEHGVRLEGVRWIQAGVDAPGRTEPVTVDYGRFDVTPAPGRSLDDLLLAGEVDAVISARPPASIERDDPRVRRLYADPGEEERAWFARTGIFPIMHLVVVRRGAYAPDMAVALIDAFQEAKRRSLERMGRPTVPSLPLPWAATHARQARAALGDDWWPYGLEPNRATLAAFLSDAQAQGLTQRRLAPEDLFPPELRAAPAA